MFDQLRVQLPTEISATQAAAEQARAAREQAQAQLDRLVEELAPLQDALTQAQARTQEADTALASARAAADQRRQDRDGAQAALDHARQALTDHMGDEPERFLPNGHLNPEWTEWREVRDQLRKAVADRQVALNQANTALTEAEQTLAAAADSATRAAAAVAAAQAPVDETTAKVAAVQERAEAAAAAIDDATRRAAQLAEQLGGLDARAARILAEPLDRADLEQAADAELADLLARRHERQRLLTRRATLAGDRAALLTAQDRTIDGVQALAQQISGWADRGRYPPLAGIVAALDALAAASRSQRARPASQRTDDLPTDRLVLVAQLEALQAVLQQAGNERDQAAAAVATAAQVLAEHEKAQP